MLPVAVLSKEAAARFGGNAFGISDSMVWFELVNHPRIQMPLTLDSYLKANHVPSCIRSKESILQLIAELRQMGYKNGRFLFIYEFCPSGKSCYGQRFIIESVRAFWQRIWWKTVSEIVLQQWLPFIYSKSLLFDDLAWNVSQHDAVMSGFEGYWEKAFVDASAWYVLYAYHRTWIALLFHSLLILPTRLYV